MMRRDVIEQNLRRRAHGVIGDSRRRIFTPSPSRVAQVGNRDKPQGRGRRHGRGGDTEAVADPPACLLALALPTQRRRPYLWPRRRLPPPARRLRFRRQPLRYALPSSLPLVVPMRISALNALLFAATPRRRRQWPHGKAVEAVTATPPHPSRRPGQRKPSSIARRS